MEVVERRAAYRPVWTRIQEQIPGLNIWPAIKHYSVTQGDLLQALHETLKEHKEQAQAKRTG